MRPLTRAESSGWQETSRHADVMAFISMNDGSRMRTTIFGSSPEGRDLPLLELGNPAGPTVPVSYTHLTLPTTERV